MSAVRSLLLLLALSVSASAQDADLIVTKTGPGNAAAGAEVEYLVTVANDGPDSASAVALDDVPAGMTFVLAQQLSGPAAVCSTPIAGDPGTVHCDFATLASGASAEFRFVFQIPEGTASGTPFTNTATVTSSGSSDPDGTNNTDAVVTNTGGQADLLVVKSGPGEAPAASDVEYIVTITNLSADDALLVALDDDIPAGMTFVLAEQTAGPAAVCSTPAVGDPGSIHCDIPLLGAGASAELRFVFQIPEETAPGTTFTNFATVTSTGTTDPNDENNTGVATTTVPLPPQTDVRVQKSSPPSAGPGTDVTFTIVVSNGEVDAEALSLEDTLPGDLTFVSLEQTGATLNCTTPAIGAGGTITCTADPYPAEGTTTLELVAHVPDQTPSGTEYTNTAVVTADNDANEENNVATAAFLVSAVDISVTKTGDASVVAGEDLSYGIAITNNGPDIALTVQLIDVIPDGATFVSLTHDSGPAPSCTQPNAGDTGTVSCFLSLLPNETTEITLVVNAGAGVTSLTNTATVTSEEFELDPSDNEDSVETTVIPSADLTVAKSGPGSAAAGDLIAYTITVENDGPSAAENVTLTDAIPAQTTFVSFNQTSGPAFTCDDTVSCSIATLAASETATFELVVRSSSGASGSVDNTASVASTTSDPDGGNNDSSVSTTMFASANVTVAKSGPATADAGTDVTYTVTITNNGPSNATSVILGDPIPAQTTFVSVDQTSGTAFTCDNTVSCTAATFAAGASATFEIVVHVDPSASGTIENTATADSAEGEPDSDTVSTTVTATALLAVAKSGPASATPGENATYTITVTNDGPSDATDVTLTDTVPAGTSFVSFTQDSGPAFTCDATVACTAVVLPAGGSAAFTFVVAVDPSATGTIENTAAADSPVSEPASDSTSTPLTAVAVLQVGKSNPGTAVAGMDVTYALTVTNDGPSDASNVTLTDLVPAQTSFVSFTQTDGPAFTCDSTVDCSIAVLPADTSATFSFVVHVGPGASGTLENTATADSADSEPATITVSTPITAEATLAVTKTGPDSAAAGTEVVYNITVTNNGPSDAANVTLTDAVPAQTTFVSFTQNSGPAFTCDNTVSCTMASLPAAATATFTFVVRIDPAASGTIENTAGVASPTSPSASDSTSTTVTSEVGLSITKNGPASAAAGTDLTYNISITNNGPSDAAEVTLTDAVPAQTTFVSFNQTFGPAFTCSGTGTVTCSTDVLAAGAAAAFELVVHAGSGASGTIENTATADSADSDPVSDTASTTVTSEAAVQVTKSGPAAAIAGTDITYTVTVTNGGPSDAASVTLTDNVPAQTTLVSATQTSGPVFTCDDTVTCTIATLPAGASATFELVMAIDPGASGSVANTATTTTTSGPSHSATVTTAVSESADLTVTKSGPAAVVQGTDITYTVTLTNAGPSNALDVVLSDPVPPQTTFVSATQTSGPTFTCDETITCTIDVFPAGATAEFTFVFHVEETASVDIANTAAVTSSTPDPVPANSAGTASTDVTDAIASLDIEKTANGTSFPPGATVIYTIEVVNDGPQTATGVTVTDVLPEGMTLVSATPTQGTCSGTSTVTCDLGTLAVDASATITLTVTLPRTRGPLANTATVSANQADPVIGDNSSTATVTILASGDEAAAGIPALSPLAMVMLALMLAGAAMVVMKR